MSTRTPSPRRRRPKGFLLAPERQLEALRLIEVSREQRGVSPTVRELCFAMGVNSTNCITGMLKALVRDGLLTRIPGTPRAYVPTEAGRRAMGGGSP